MFRFFVVSVSLAFVIGCAVGYMITVPTVSLLLFIGILSLSLYMIRRYPIAILICVSCIALLLGMLRVTVADERRNADWGAVYGETIAVRGTVTGDVEHRERVSRYTVALQSLHLGDQLIDLSGSVLVYEPYPSRCVTGEDVAFTARLVKPENFLTEANRVFLYEQYLRQLGVYAIARIDNSGCDGKDSRFAIFAFLRFHFMNAVHRVLPVQEASLLGGLLLGLRGSLSAELLEVFRITGLIHIIVLSGYNITLVAEAVRRVLSRTPPMFSFVCSLVTIILFVLLAGAQTAAVRAGSMASIALVARALHREYDGVRILVFVGALMVLYNPEQALYSTSFHMSFLATLGLLIFSPVFERYFVRLTDRFQVRSIVSATLATQLFLLPYLAYSIGEVSIIGLLANMVILPLVPLAMAFGALLILIAVILPPAALIVAPIAYFPLTLIIRSADMFASVPYASVPLPQLPAFLMLACVVFLVYVGYEFGGVRQSDAED